MKKLFKDLSHTQSRLYRGDLYIEDIQLEGKVVDIGIEEVTYNEADGKYLTMQVKLTVEHFVWNPAAEKYDDKKTVVFVPKEKFNERFAVYKRL